MSITLVSSLPKPAQPASTATADSTANNAPASDTAAGQDFASLLLGQLLPATNEAAPENTLKTELSEDDKAPADPSSLFAALGIIPNEVKPVSEPVTQPDASLPALDNADEGNAGKLKSLASLTPQTDQKSGLPAAVTTPPASPTPVTSEQPAKFAVPVSTLPETETLASSKTTETLATANTTTLPPGAPVVQNTQPNRQDVQISVPTPVRDQSWTNDFGQKVVWLATNDKQSAQITLNPPQMGPIEISITMDKGSATASFVSANAEVRENIETALPRLREMFASAGIELGQANVSAESFKQQASNDEWKSPTPRWSNDNAILVTNSSGSMPASAFVSRQGNGRVDIFA